jgi:3-oxoadipate enol-lactonase
MQANISGVNLFFESCGEGHPPLVFTHGLGGTSNVWHPQRATLSRYHRVVTYDLSGSGRSDRGRREYAIERWADELAGLLEHLDIGSAVIVGHSMGTVITQVFAARYPEKTAALVLAGALTELTPAGQEAFAARAETVQKDGMIAVADAVLSGGLTAGTREGNPALTGLAREMLLTNDPHCYAGQCRALMAGSAREVQETIQAPTLLLVGDQDPVTPLEVQRHIASAIRDCRIRVVPDTAHLTMLERPGAFNAVLLEFLAGL